MCSTRLCLLDCRHWSMRRRRNHRRNGMQSCGTTALHLRGISRSSRYSKGCFFLLPLRAKVCPTLLGMERLVYIPNRHLPSRNLTIKKGQLLQIVRKRTNATVLSPCREFTNSEQINQQSCRCGSSFCEGKKYCSESSSRAVCAYAKIQKTAKSTWHHVHAAERTVLLALSAIFDCSRQCRPVRSPMELLQILVRVPLLSNDYLHRICVY